MDTQNPEVASLTPASRAGSEEPLVGVAAPTGSSNRRAFKVAGLTTLACLLLASQVFTAYMVVSQKQEIHNLQKNSEQMTKQMTRTSRVAPMKMHLSSLPLLMDAILDEDPKTTKTPVTKLEDTAVVAVEKQLTDFLGNPELPQFNHTFLANLLDLQGQMEENEWQNFTSWMRYWLIFQMAQEKPPAPPTPQPALVIKTKCQMEAAVPHSRLFGSFKPQCEEDGSYKPVQCWHSTGNCWCVNEEGTPTPGTTTRGRLQCPRVPRRMVMAPRMMMNAENDK